MKILFRADASFQIGSGHMIRCVTLAKSLRERGADCRFVCRDHEGNFSEYARNQGFVVDLLPLTKDSVAASKSFDDQGLYGQWLGASQETDAEETIQCLSDAKMDWVVVDHYGIDRRWETQIRPHTKNIMVIDDLANRHHDCDFLLDQNLVSGFRDRYDALVPETCVKLLGPEYAILQPEYAELHPRTPPRIGPVSRILVYFGAADVNNLTGLTLESLKAPRFSEIEIDVVISKQSPNYEKVRSAAIDNGRVYIHDSLPSLAPLMMKADLAIGSAGATSWERCCLGLPAIIITLAANQIAIAHELDKHGLATWLGDQQNINSDLLREAVLGGIENSEESSRQSMKSIQLIDGQGTQRIAEQMFLSAETGLVARLANLSDELLLLRWVNDPLVRKNSFDSSAIDSLTHKQWFYRRLRDLEGTAIYIVSTTDGFTIGQVRFELREGDWEIDYSLDRMARGRRLGKELLKKALSQFLNSHPECTISAHVKEGNIASKTLLEQLGFVNVQMAAERLTPKVYRLILRVTKLGIAF